MGISEYLKRNNATTRNLIGDFDFVNFKTDTEEGEKLVVNFERTKENKKFPANPTMVMVIVASECESDKLSSGKRIATSSGALTRAYEDNDLEGGEQLLLEFGELKEHLGNEYRQVDISLIENAGTAQSEPEDVI